MEVHYYPQGLKPFLYGWVAEVNQCWQVHQPSTVKLNFTEEGTQEHNCGCELCRLNWISTPSKAGLS